MGKVNSREVVVELHNKLSQEIKKVGMDLAAQIVDLKRSLDSEADSEEEHASRRDIDEYRMISPTEAGSPTVRQSHEFPPAPISHFLSLNSEDECVITSPL